MTFRADALIEAFGCNVHLRYPSYRDKYDVLKARIKELGVRHLRDGLGNDALFFQHIKELNANGARFCFIVEPRDYQNIDQSHTILTQSIGVSRVAAVEGVNEADGYFAETVPNWAQVTREHQRALFTAMRADPQTASIPVYAPTVVSVTGANTLGDLSAAADFGNLHRYPGSRHPETLGWGGRLNGVKYGDLEYGLVNVANVIVPGKPVVLTESGYFNSGVGNRVSEEVAGKYFPRLLLHHLTSGIARTYAYELVDQSADPTNWQSNFGLIRFNGTGKPAFVALRNMFALLRDTSGSFTPTPFDVVATGDVTDLRTVVFQKRNGVFYLAYWLAKPSWDPIALKPLTVPPQTFFLAGVSGAQWVCPRFNLLWAVAPRTADGVQLTATDYVRVARLEVAAQATKSVLFASGHQGAEMSPNQRSWLRWLLDGPRHDVHLHDLLHSIKQQGNLIMATQAELAQQLRDMTTQNEKARAENLKRLKALQDAIDAGNASTPEVDEAIAALKASIQAEDDENPDEETPPV